MFVLNLIFLFWIVLGFHAFVHRQSIAYNMGWWWFHTSHEVHLGPANAAAVRYGARGVEWARRQLSWSAVLSWQRLWQSQQQRQVSETVFTLSASHALSVSHTLIIDNDALHGTCAVQYMQWIMCVRGFYHALYEND